MKRSDRFHRHTPRWGWLVAAAMVILPGAGLSIQDRAGALAAQGNSRDEGAAVSANDNEKPALKKKSALLLKYGDGKADGKKSFGGSGQMIQFVMPGSEQQVKAIRIHGSRYGYPKAPKENFSISILSEDMSEVVHTEMAPYSLFHRGKEKWVRVAFKEPVEVPEKFWLVLDFNAEQTKGVYVSFDTSTGGKHSRKGLVGTDPAKIDFGGDWMVQVLLTK